MGEGSHSRFADWVTLLLSLHLRALHQCFGAIDLRYSSYMAKIYDLHPLPLIAPWHLSRDWYRLRS
jgi:hypothetical protein